jgi:hypothetical protein
LTDQNRFNKVLDMGRFVLITLSLILIAVLGLFEGKVLACISCDVGYYTATERCCGVGGTEYGPGAACCGPPAGQRECMGDYTKLITDGPCY